MTKTKELSVLKMLLQDEDDSALIEVESRSDLNKLSNAKIDVVNRLLREIEARLADEPEEAELRDQLANLIASIDEQSVSVSDQLDSRRAVSSTLQNREQLLASLATELSEAAALKGRFGILQQRYSSDLARLAAVREAGNLLGYFTAGVCAFCGAELTDQHNNTDCEGHSTAFGSAIAEQIRRTQALAHDLQSTIDDLTDRQENVRQRTNSYRQDIDELQAQFEVIENSLAIETTTLKDLIGKRTSIERALSLYDQIEALEKMKQVVVDESTAEIAVVAASLGLRAQREFSHELADRLKAWGFPQPEGVRYDGSVQDIVAGDQLRSSHGKGVRAILHCAFTLGLASYCSDREMPHPGFVVLDSPLVTYRPPDQPQTDDGTPPAGVVAAFYRDVQRRSSGQVIILENTDPIEPLDGRTVDIVFTASENGRYGFFPARWPEELERQSE